MSAPNANEDPAVALCRMIKDAAAASVGPGTVFGLTVQSVSRNPPKALSDYIPDGLPACGSSSEYPFLMRNHRLLMVISLLLEIAFIIMAFSLPNYDATYDTIPLAPLVLHALVYALCIWCEPNGTSKSVFVGFCFAGVLYENLVGLICSLVAITHPQAGCWGAIAAFFASLSAFLVYTRFIPSEWTRVQCVIDRPTNNFGLQTAAYAGASVVAGQLLTPQQQPQQQGVPMAAQQPGVFIPPTYSTYPTTTQAAVQPMAPGASAVAPGVAGAPPQGGYFIVAAPGTAGPSGMPQLPPGIPPGAQVFYYGYAPGAGAGAPGAPGGAMMMPPQQGGMQQYPFPPQGAYYPSQGGYTTTAAPNAGTTYSAPDAAPAAAASASSAPTKSA